MLSLDFPAEPYWLELPRGVRAEIRPVTTAVTAAAQATVSRRLRAIRAASDDLDPGHQRCPRKNWRPSQWAGLPPPPRSPMRHEDANPACIEALEPDAKPCVQLGPGILAHTLRAGASPRPTRTLRTPEVGRPDVNPACGSLAGPTRSLRAPEVGRPYANPACGSLAGPTRTLRAPEVGRPYANPACGRAAKAPFPGPETDPSRPREPKTGTDSPIAAWPDSSQASR
jgi:hypothetical protein